METPQLSPYHANPFTDITTATASRIGWLLLNRPEVSNAVRPHTMREICEALDQFIADPAIDGIVLTGTGRHFLAGADFEFLKELSTAAEADTQTKLYTYFKGAAERLWRCPKPTIAAVNGAAITVGCELALMCDLRIITSKTIFQEPWLRLGLIAPLGGSVILPRFVGLDVAKKMLLAGDPLKGEAAVQAGLASELVAETALRAHAQARILQLTAYPPGAYQVLKEAIHCGIESTMDAEWSRNIASQAALLSGSPFRDALAAVASGAKPSVAS